MSIRTVALSTAIALAPSLLVAQFDFSLAGRKIQIHSFASQGFAYSNNNNYLTLKTSQGSFAMTDGGVNISTQLADKLRVGAQVYIRNIGNLGQWHPNLDWATADYKPKDWFGLRAGKVKTVLGLHNDTQDMEFLHAFALLPQSVYPMDLRDSTIAHLGGDVYGSIPLKELGSLSYTAFAGRRKDTRYGGYPYIMSGFGVGIEDYSGRQVGGDLRWHTPVNGLLAGVSHLREHLAGTGTVDFNPAQWGMPGEPMTMPFKERTRKDFTNAFYGKYESGRVLLEAEYRRGSGGHYVEAFEERVPKESDVRGWYASAAYRITNRFQAGSYYSRFVMFWAPVPALGILQSGPQSSPDRHIYDKVVTARFDVTRFWNLKVEGHFIDGHGFRLFPTGFYTLDNPGGLKPKTNLLIIRTGWNF